jgi:hypothetical protein
MATTQKRESNNCVNRFCDSCDCWEFVYEDGNGKFGICSNVMAADKIRLVRDEESLEDTTIFTSSVFGCIYHDAGEDLSVVRIDPEKLSED